MPRRCELGPLLWLVTGAAGLFLLLGTLLIPRAGLDADEALFTNPLYRSLGADFELGVLHHKIPVMLIAYIGAFKTALCWPILRLFGPSIYAVRLPMVLAGAATILLFFFLAETLAGRIAAACAALLLATDPTFLLTETFDWGPVALEHLLLVSGCLAMISRRPALASLLFGLALWNKATFAWSLTGLIAATLMAYWPQAREFLRDRRLLLRCGLAFIIGALPLLLFNLHRRAATLHASQGISLTQDAAAKLHQLRAALDGSGLFGYLTSGASPRSSIFVYAFALAILAIPLWWRSAARRAGIFALVFCAVTFFCMFITRGAGTGIHHTVLLWPMPQLLVGVALSALRPRSIPAVVVALLAASNLLVIDRYFVELDRAGATGNFTDAVSTLANNLSSLPNSPVYVADWGIYEALVYLQQGRVPLHYSPLLLVAEHPSPAQRRSISAMIADPKAIFVTHIASREMFPGVRARLEAIARSGGYTRRIVETIPDSKGHPVYELWRFSAPRRATFIP
ncbi:MAG TPA: glycosyltransferase family 39 protein [Bryobacteraceae bacterium]|nr:glycosyltransferase family 39 protein [Bryobacteraceae bacterium]